MSMRDVPGYEGRYRVSDEGEVWGPRGNLLGGHLVDGGYRRVQFYDQDGRRRHHLVHRLVLLAFVGPCPPGMEARHLDDNPANNRLANLKWGTHSENILDSVRNGNHPWAGKTSPRSGYRATHCNHGHEYSDENTYWPPTGSRQCKKCNARRSRESYQRSRA